MIFLKSLLFTLLFYACANDNVEALKKQLPISVKYPNEIDFKKVTIGQRFEKKISLENLSNNSFKVFSIFIQPKNNELELSPIFINEPKEIAGKTSFLIKAIYQPLNVGPDQFFVEIKTNIKGKESIFINIKGLGIRPQCDENKALVWNGKSNGKCICKPLTESEEGICKQLCKVKNACPEKNRSVCSIKENKRFCSCNKGFRKKYSRSSKTVN